MHKIWQEKVVKTWAKKIAMDLAMLIVRYWQILVINQMAPKILVSSSFGNQILAFNQSDSQLYHNKHKPQQLVESFTLETYKTYA
jgi:hypothetical protein